MADDPRWPVRGSASHVDADFVEAEHIATFRAALNASDQDGISAGMLCPHPIPDLGNRSHLFL